MAGSKIDKLRHLSDRRGVIAKITLKRPRTISPDSTRKHVPTSQSLWHSVLCGICHWWTTTNAFSASNRIPNKASHRHLRYFSLSPRVPLSCCDISPFSHNGVVAKGESCTSCVSKQTKYTPQVSDNQKIP